MDLLVAAPSLQVDALRLQASVSTVPLRSSLRTWCGHTDAEAGLRTMMLKAPGHHLFHKGSRGWLAPKPPLPLPFEENLAGLLKVAKKMCRCLRCAY